jgi:hypothetical protein
VNSLPWPFTLPVGTLALCVAILAFLAGLARTYPVLALLIGVLIAVYIFGM